MKRHLITILFTFCTIASFNSCDKTNYATNNEEYVGFWQANYYRYSAYIEVTDDGEADYKQELYEPGSDNLIKTIKKKGKFKITNDNELYIGRKKFIITLKPDYNTLDRRWYLELNDTMLLHRYDDIGPTYEED